MSKEVKELNKQIMSASKKLRDIDDYFQVIDAVIPMLKLLIKLSGKADLDDGKDKKSWSLCLGDALTIHQDVSDAYSDTADLIHELNKLKPKETK